MAFRGLQVESVAQGEAHRTIAQDLEKLVLDPFSEWAGRHKERITDSGAVLDEWIRQYERGQSDVSFLATNCRLELYSDKPCTGPSST